MGFHEEHKVYIIYFYIIYIMSSAFLACGKYFTTHDDLFKTTSGMVFTNKKGMNEFMPFFQDFRLKIRIMAEWRFRL